MENKIIVTGGSGFVGRHTVKALLDLGYKVLNVDLDQGYDFRDRNMLRGIINEGDKVLHLGAIAKFSEADKDPLLVYEVNMRGTENIVQVCNEKGVERLIYASTGSVYMPIRDEMPIKESYQVRGNSIYGVSKCVGEKLVEKSKVPYMMLRYAHLYGGGKVGHGAIGGFIDKMDKGESPVIFGGKQSNDFTYIKDIVDANILALDVRDKKAFSQAYNIGSGVEVTTEDVFKQMKEFFKYDKKLKYFPQRGVDAQRFVYDISKAKELLGYEPKFTIFKEGLADWFKDEKNPKK